MKILLLQTGKTQPDYIEQGIREYERRLRRYHPFEIRLLPGLKKEKARTEEEQKKLEAKMILKACRAGDFLVLLDEGGREYNSRAFARFMEQKLIMSYKQLVFIEQLYRCFTIMRSEPYHHD